MRFLQQQYDICTTERKGEQKRLQQQEKQKKWQHRHVTNHSIFRHSFLPINVSRLLLVHILSVFVWVTLFGPSYYVVGKKERATEPPTISPSSFDDEKNMVDSMSPSITITSYDSSQISDIPTLPPSKSSSYTGPDFPHIIDNDDDDETPITTLSEIPLPRLQFSMIVMSSSSGSDNNMNATLNDLLETFFNTFFQEGIYRNAYETITLVTSTSISEIMVDDDQRYLLHEKEAMTRPMEEQPPPPSDYVRHKQQQKQQQQQPYLEEKYDRHLAQEAFTLLKAESQGNVYFTNPNTITTSTNPNNTFDNDSNNNNNDNGIPTTADLEAVLIAYFSFWGTEQLQLHLLANGLPVVNSTTSTSKQISEYMNVTINDVYISKVKTSEDKEDDGDVEDENESNGTGGVNTIRNNSSAKNEKKILNSYTLAGVVIGIAVIAIALGILIFAFHQRRRKIDVPANHELLFDIDQSNNNLNDIGNDNENNFNNNNDEIDNVNEGRDNTMILPTGPDHQIRNTNMSMDPYLDPKSVQYPGEGTSDSHNIVRSTGSNNVIVLDLEDEHVVKNKNGKKKKKPFFKTPPKRKLDNNNNNNNYQNNNNNSATTNHGLMGATPSPFTARTQTTTASSMKLTSLVNTTHIIDDDSLSSMSNQQQQQLQQQSGGDVAGSGGNNSKNKSSSSSSFLGLSTSSSKLVTRKFKINQSSSSVDEMNDGKEQVRNNSENGLVRNGESSSSDGYGNAESSSNGDDDGDYNNDGGSIVSDVDIVSVTGSILSSAVYNKSYSKKHRKRDIPDKVITSTATDKIENTNNHATITPTS